MALNLDKHGNSDHNELDAAGLGLIQMKIEYNWNNLETIRRIEFDFVLHI